MIHFGCKSMATVFVQATLCVLWCHKCASVYLESWSFPAMWFMNSGRWTVLWDFHVILPCRRGVIGLLADCRIHVMNTKWTWQICPEKHFTSLLWPLGILDHHKIGTLISMSKQCTCSWIISGNISNVLGYFAPLLVRQCSYKNLWKLATFLMNKKFINK